MSDLFVDSFLVLADALVALVQRYPSNRVEVQRFGPNSVGVRIGDNTYEIHLTDYGEVCYLYIDDNGGLYDLVF